MIPIIAPIRTVLAAPRSAVRNQLRAWLRQERDVRIVGEAPNGHAALRLIERECPDLALLHLNLPRLDGFGVLAALAETRRLPAVILLAPGPDGAIRAFGARVTDYLQIPFDTPRLRQSLDRVRDHLQRHAAGRRPRTGAADPAGVRLALPVSGRLRLIDLHDLQWVRAARRRSELHLREGVLLADLPFGTLEQRLPRETFVQINRSVIVRQDFVRETRRKSHGDHWVIFDDGEQLVLSRQRRPGVLRRLGFA